MSAPVYDFQEMHVPIDDKRTHLYAMKEASGDGWEVVGVFPFIKPKSLLAPDVDVQMMAIIMRRPVVMTREEVESN